MTLDPRDAVLQAHTPAVMVPRHGELALLDKPGHRYLVAEDGLWLEVRRSWLHLRALIAPIMTEEIRTPFGAVAADLGFGGKEFGSTYAFGPEDLSRLQSLFVYDARAALPDEFAAWGVWNDRERRLEYRPLISTDASPGSVTFSRPALEDHESLAVDMHSHGSMDAFFSSTDDADDAGEVKLSVVFGRLDGELMVATRLCALGLFIDADSQHASAREDSE